MDGLKADDWLERHSQHLFCPLPKHVAYDDALFTSSICFIL